MCIRDRSISNQKLMLRDYAEKNGMFQYEYYVDDGYTGDVYKRQVLDKSRLSIRLVPPYSEERKAAASAYAREHGFQVVTAEEKIA